MTFIDFRRHSFQDTFPNATLTDQTHYVWPVLELSDDAWPLTVRAVNLLSGGTQPDPSWGNPNDLYEDIVNGVLYGPKAGSGWGPQQRPAITGTPNAASGTGELGARYRFGRAGRVVGFRYFRYSGTAVTMTFRVWNDTSQVKLDEVTDTQAGVTAPFTVMLATPIMVLANDLLTFTFGGSSLPRTSVTPSVTSTADVTFVEMRSHSSANNWPNTAVTTITHFIEPIFEANDPWPVTVRQVPLGTEAVVGSLRFATVAETITGTSTALAVHPAGLNAQYIPKLISINARGAGAYTFVLADQNKLVAVTDASLVTLTIPPNASVAFPVGATMDVARLGAGAVVIAGGAGVTVNATPGLSLRAQYSTCTLIQRAANTWLLVGDLA